MVTGEELRACRYAREVVADMRWRGMTVPGLYTRMAKEFEDLVRSGDYATWVAASRTPAMDRKLHAAGAICWRPPTRATLGTPPAPEAGDGRHGPGVA